MKIVAVSSGKGGAGKSCTAAYTGFALAKAGKKALLMELGADPRSLDMILGLPGSALFHIRDLADGSCDFPSAAVQSPYHAMLSLIPASPDPFAPAVTGAEFERIYPGIPEDTDFLILDGVDFAVFPAALPDCTVLVATPDSLSVRANAALAEMLWERGAREIRLVINNVPAKVLPMQGFPDFDGIIDAVGARLLAVVPASPKLAYAAGNAQPVGEASLVPRVFESLAARLLGEDRPLLVR